MGHVLENHLHCFPTKITSKKWAGNKCVVKRPKKMNKKIKLKKHLVSGGGRNRKRMPAAKKSFIGHPTCAQQNNNFLGGVWGEMVAMGSNEMGNDVN